MNVNSDVLTNDSASGFHAGEVVDYIFEIAPNPSHAWENVYLFGGAATPVRGIAVAWWITLDIVEEMARSGLTLGISHERVIFETGNRFVWGTLPEQDEIHAHRRLKELTDRHGLAIHQMHSNIDKVAWGMPHALLARLEWQDSPADWSRGVPVIEIPPKPLRELVREVKEKLGLPFVRYDGDPDRVVSRIALPWGGLCQGYGGPLCPSPLGFDVVMGGDIIDGVVRLARAQGWAVVDAMHHATEMDAMRVLADKLRARFAGVEVRFFENDSPWCVL
jgi:putative NIF3 family GTP cyclohydrolase 1 type 2